MTSSKYSNLKKKSIKTCSHPLEGMKIFRDLHNSGQDLPKTLVLLTAEEQCVIERMGKRIRKLYGQNPMLLVVKP